MADPIIAIGCFSRVETNGGGFEQVNLLFGENPNIAVRNWTQPFNDAGIQTQMLKRGLNGIRMSPVGSDVRQLMFKVKRSKERTFPGALMDSIILRTFSLPFNLPKKEGWSPRVP